MQSLKNNTQQNTVVYEMLNREEVLSHKRLYWFGRRTQDILFSAMALVGLLPLLAIVSLLIYLDDPHGSPIFIQERCGRDGKVFRMYKFRSMVMNAESLLDGLLDANEKDGPAFKIKDDPRLTRVGKIIRKTSIDELPQLVNVLRGDMSVVGPRPAIVREVEQYTEFEKQRLFVTPGLTCYWQIQPHRDKIKFDDWVRLDIQYIKDRSFLVDWKIIFQTFGAVIRGSGE